MSTAMPVGVVAATLALAIEGGMAMAQDTAEARHLISTQASERATGGMGNKMVTLGDRTHCVWQDSTPEGYWARVRTYDRAAGAWGDTVTLGQGVDNHARPTIAADADGFLHVIIGGHNSPYQYLRSVAPNDARAWTGPVAFGKGTYPFLVCGPDKRLFLAGRPASHNGVDLYVREPEGEWTFARELALKREPQYREYAGYNTVLAWGPGHRRLHMACDVYEGLGTYKGRGENQLVVYLVSEDMGRTWKRADGSAIDGEPFPKNLDVIAASSRKREQNMPQPVLRLGGLVVDAADRPYVLYTSDEPERGRAGLVTPDGSGGWRDLGLAAALAGAYPGLGTLGPRAGFSLASDGTLRMCLPMAPLEDFGVPGAPAIKAERVRYIVATTADGGLTYRFSEPVPSGDGVTRHQITLERPTGFAPVGADGHGTGMMYFEGLMRYPRSGEVLQNQLYYVELP